MWAHLHYEESIAELPRHQDGPCKGPEVGKHMSTSGGCNHNEVVTVGPQKSPCGLEAVGVSQGLFEGRDVEMAAACTVQKLQGAHTKYLDSSLPASWARAALTSLSMGSRKGRQH